MQRARAAAVLAALGPATSAWCQSEDPGRILEQANAAVTSMSLERALPLYEKVQLKAQDAAALFGQSDPRVGVAGNEKHVLRRGNEAGVTTGTSY